MSSDLFFFTSLDDEDEVNIELAFSMEAVNAVIQASNSIILRNQVERDHYGAHDRLEAAYISEHPHYNEATFRTWFRMSKNIEKREETREWRGRERRGKREREREERDGSRRREDEREREEEKEERERVHYTIEEREDQRIDEREREE
ncbi:hypothetical protein Tco_1129702 [Tanacetum coccineum]